MPLFNPPYIPDLYISSQSNGDICYFSGSHWSRLPIGASGSVFYTSGTNAVPRWVNPIISSSLGSTSAPTTTSTSFRTIPQMALTASIQGLDVFLSFFGCFNMLHNDNWQFAIFVDGSEKAGTRQTMNFIASTGITVTNGSLPGTNVAIFTFINGLQSGSHTFDVRWIVTGGTARAVGTQRAFNIREIF